MKQTINLYKFQNEFDKIRPDSFSYEGLSALFEYLEQWEEDTGEELELDVIAICCDFNQDTWENIAQNYRIDLGNCEDEEEKQQAVADYLSEEGAFVAQVADSFVYRNF
jgi:predicted ArsR family transcriptional regulator